MCATLALKALYLLGYVLWRSRSLLYDGLTYVRPCWCRYVCSTAWWGRNMWILLSWSGYHLLKYRRTWFSFTILFIRFDRSYFVILIFFFSISTVQISFVIGSFIFLIGVLSYSDRTRPHKFFYVQGRAFVIHTLSSKTVAPFCGGWFFGPGWFVTAIWHTDFNLSCCNNCCAAKSNLID